jgi:DNA polymerase III epsilon subunit-like protein
MHGMIDLETLGTSPTSQILTIGAVKFNPYSDAEPFDDLYLKLELEEQDEKGRTIDDGTVKWWGTQPADIITEAFTPDGRVSVDTAMTMLKKWYVGLNGIWAQGVCFDITMIENICGQFKKPIPWAFYHVNDSRTLLNLAKTDPRKSFSFAAHNALEDARVQAKSVQIVMKNIADGFEVKHR